MESDHANVTLHEISHKMTFDLSFLSSVKKNYIIIKIITLFVFSIKRIKKREERQKMRRGKRKGKTKRKMRLSHSIRHAMRGRERSSLLSFYL